MSARALQVDGAHTFVLTHNRKVRRVQHLELEPGGPLLSDRCKARVWRGAVSWWWDCPCIFSAGGRVSSWEKAFRAAYRHVRLSWLLEAAAELKREEEDGT